jgi:hypothetical protein
MKEQGNKGNIKQSQGSWIRRWQADGSTLVLCQGGVHALACLVIDDIGLVMKSNARKQSQSMW